MLDRRPILNIKSSIEKLTTLPAMPSMANKLLELRNRADTDANDLARVIELDPSLAGQVMHYASSAFYGYRGELTSIKDAVARVLGYDRVMHMALGLAIGRSFRLTPYGPIGLQNVWRQAIYSAALTEMLVGELAERLRPAHGICYLGGLLHNIGFLVLGYLYPREFNALNKAIGELPDVRTLDTENYILGTTHCEIGAWMMRKWDMPDELIVAILEHHNDEYDGPHYVHANLLLVADRLLRRYGIGDMPSGDLPEDLLERLGLTEDAAVTALDRLIESTKALDFMVSEMVSAGS